MIRNLRDTTRKNAEQDWLKTNLARFTGMLQGQNDIKTVAQAHHVGARAAGRTRRPACFYLNEPVDEEPLLNLMAGYRALEAQGAARTFRPGEGLVGQCVVEKRRILLTDVPPDYISKSPRALGSTRPLDIIVLPVLFEGDVKAVIELASSRTVQRNPLALPRPAHRIDRRYRLNTIAANMRTEELLKQSQSLTTELQSQQMELQQTNEELEEKARLLAEQNEEVEKRTREIEEARRALEQKAEQLALTSKYKSQFLANMSHELRTPLNSLLILSKQLVDNREQNLPSSRSSWPRRSARAGADLLTLINDILDLSKIESGTTSIDIARAARSPISATTSSARSDRRRARHEPRLHDLGRRRAARDARNRHTRLHADSQEPALQRVQVHRRRQRRAATSRASTRSRFDGIAGPAVAFAVTDTGIGIPPDKHNVIFEAFQQADMSTARKYGGTGLGLAISREIAGLLGGEMTRRIARSGVGSTFTFYHPLERTSRTTVVQRTVAHYGRRPGTYRSSGIAAPAPKNTRTRDRRRSRRASKPHDRVVLIIEDDVIFARILLGLARDRGFKGIVALSAARRAGARPALRPDAITLDIGLPDVDGWELLEQLKRDPATADIPVHVISGEEQWQRALDSGAFAHLKKPVTEEALTQTFDSLLGFGGARLETSARRRGRRHAALGDGQSHRKRRSRRHRGVHVRPKRCARSGTQRYDCVDRRSRTPRHRRATR